MPCFSRFHVCAPAIWLAAAAALLTGCAGQPAADAPTATGPEPLAALKLSQTSSRIGAIPAGWEPWIIRSDKKKTTYEMASRLIGNRSQNVLHAVAQSAASGLWVPMDVSAQVTPFVNWSWRAAAMVPGADSTRAETEDAPVRLILAFDGDWSKLPLRDQMMAETARMLLGRDMPYATLIYTWDVAQPVGAVLPNAYSGRIKKKIVESGPERVGQWLSYQRNYAADYAEAFGEVPGKLIGIGVLTDSDNTHSHAEGWYGDIHVSADGETALAQKP